MSFNAKQILLGVNYIIMSIKLHEFDVHYDIGIFKKLPCPSWLGSENRAMVCGLKGAWFDSS